MIERPDKAIHSTAVLMPKANVQSIDHVAFLTTNLAVHLGSSMLKKQVCDTGR